jgi:putative restriction endonuclease
MVTKQGRISEFFGATLGAPFNNPRWSWGSTNPKTGQVFLRVWTDDRDRIRGVDCVKVLGSEWASTSRGNTERRRHVELLKGGAEGYGVFCVPRDSETTGQRSIASFDRDQLFKFGPVFTSGRDTYATILGQIPLEEVVHRQAASDSLLEDLESIWATASSVTTKQILADARIGQGKFREQVLRLWDDRCCVSGSQTLYAVRASHIKPWRQCDDRERLDPSNGLPLVATLDALFDVGLITFDNDGTLLTATVLTKPERKMLGVAGLKLGRKPGRRTGKYLEYHRSEVFRDRDGY